MSISADALRKLAALELDPKQMAGVLDILAGMAAADEERRANQRNRTRKHRAKRDGNVTVTSPERDTPPPPPSPDENLTPNPPLPPQDPSTPKGVSSPSEKITPRTELEKVLDAEHASDLIDHRKRLGSPLTASSARKLAAKVAKWPDPNEAVDEMLAAGWTGFEPEWLERRKGGLKLVNGHGPPDRPKTASEVIEERRRARQAGQL